MGWWNHGEDGSSLHEEFTGLVWGDRPADIIDDVLTHLGGSSITSEVRDRRWRTALNDVRLEFQKAFDRDPTRQEILAGVLFSLGEVRSFAYDMKDGPAPEPMQTAPGMLNVGPLSDEEWSGLRSFTKETDA